MASAPAPAPAWHDLYRLLPEELAAYMPSLAWDHERLWTLELPVERVAVPELEWQLDLPWWRHGDRFFAVCPRDVLAAPEQHYEQFERTLAADLAFPIDLTLRRGRWFVLDGVHRLLKAVMLGEETIAARRVSPEQLRLISAG